MHCTQENGEDVLLLNKPRANEVMDKYDLDGLLAAPPQNVYYLTDHVTKDGFEPLTRWRTEMRVLE